MQTNYPNKLPTPHWDTVNIEYPVRKYLVNCESSETTSRRYRGQPEVIKRLKEPVNEIKDYTRDYNVTKELNRSQATLDFGYKAGEAHRFNKHTSSIENLYIYPPNRKLAERPPQCSAHGTSEMRSAYKVPTISPRLITDKDQFKHPVQFILEPSWHKDLEPLDTTYDGFEKYLDPYLTTSRLYHRPYTANQINRANSKNIITYYTLSNESWVRTPKPKAEDWFLSPNRHKPIYDRNKFKEEFREIRRHNKMNWVPGSFKTETKDNYERSLARPETRIGNHEDVRREYHREILSLHTNAQQEGDVVKETYKTENSHIGSGKPLCAVINQFVDNNKRLERKI